MRDTTNKLLEMCEDGVLRWETLARCCVKYMSEDEVTDMAFCNELIQEEESDTEALEEELDEDTIAILSGYIPYEDGGY